MRLQANRTNQADTADQVEKAKADQADQADQADEAQAKRSRHADQADEAKADQADQADQARLGPSGARTSPSNPTLSLQIARPHCTQDCARRRTQQHENTVQTPVAFARAGLTIRSEAATSKPGHGSDKQVGQHVQHVVISSDTQRDTHWQIGFQQVCPAHMSTEILQACRKHGAAALYFYECYCTL